MSETNSFFPSEKNLEMALYDNIGGATAVRAALDTSYPRVLADLWWERAEQRPVGAHSPSVSVPTAGFSMPRSQIRHELNTILP